MQQSSMNLFCDKCGRANEPDASYCIACQHPLAQVNSGYAPTIQTALNTVSPASGEAIAESLSPFGQQNVPTVFQPGAILGGHYKIEKEIGCGGFSIVYCATDLNNQNRQVAIKRIHLSTLTPRQIIDATETFNREVAMLSLLKGEYGIPLFYEYLIDAENWYLIMEYISGQTLEEYLQSKPEGFLTEEEIITIGIKLAQILQKLHKRQEPVIFRDVKPANIMITPDQKLYLIDFGVARYFIAGKTRDTTPFGSPGYAAPEQYGHAQTDERSDIYSLGITLQTLFTGRDPLELADGSPSRNPKTFSPALQQLLNTMLSPDPEQRSPDMIHVQALLEGAQHQNNQRTLTASYTFLQSFIMGIIVETIIALSSTINPFTWSSLFIAGLILFLCFILVVIAKWFRKKNATGQKTFWQLSLPGFLIGFLIGLVGGLIAFWLWRALGL